MGIHTQVVLYNLPLFLHLAQRLRVLALYHALVALQVHHPVPHRVAFHQQLLVVLHQHVQLLLVVLDFHLQSMVQLLQVLVLHLVVQLFRRRSCQLLLLQLPRQLAHAMLQLSNFVRHSGHLVLVVDYLQLEALHLLLELLVLEVELVVLGLVVLDLVDVLVHFPALLVLDLDVGHHLLVLHRLQLLHLLDLEGERVDVLLLRLQAALVLLILLLNLLDNFSVSFS